MRKTNTITAVEQSPFPHVVVEDFLDDDTIDLVIDALAGLEYSFSAVSYTHLTLPTSDLV